MDELIRILKAEELTCVVLQKQRLYKEHANGILPIPVSYTHLDVYKRQLHNSLHRYSFMKTQIHQLTEKIQKIHRFLKALPVQIFKAGKVST